MLHDEWERGLRSRDLSVLGKLSVVRLTARLKEKKALT